VIGNDPPAIECLDQIQVPTLILIGQHDLHDFHVISDLLLARIPHAQKIQLQDAGHVIPMEASAKFNEVVMEFLERRGRLAEYRLDEFEDNGIIQS
jgi:pimeloyl-ACP methyl ester carboxylesterase